MKKRRIFVIDDEKELLEVYQATLSPYYEIVLFDLPSKLIKTVEEGQIPDVFVSDLKMPEMTGIELIEWVRKKKIDRPVVIISGYSEKSDAIRALELGVVDLLE